MINPNKRHHGSHPIKGSDKRFRNTSLEQLYNQVQMGYMPVNALVQLRNSYKETFTLVLAPILVQFGLYRPFPEDALKKIEDYFHHSRKHAHSLTFVECALKFYNTPNLWRDVKLSAADYNPKPFSSAVKKGLSDLYFFYRKRLRLVSHELSSSNYKNNPDYTQIIENYESMEAAVTVLIYLFRQIYLKKMPTTLEPSQYSTLVALDPRCQKWYEPTANASLYKLHGERHFIRKLNLTAATALVLIKVS